MDIFDLIKAGDAAGLEALLERQPEAIRQRSPEGVRPVLFACYRMQGGLLEKQISELRPGEVLAFEVVRQHGVEDRSIELLSGSFVLEAVENGTRLRLSTVYRPLLQARLLWRPFEHRLATVLHEHVLDGIALNLGQESEVRSD